MVAQYVSPHKSKVENYNVHFRQHPRLSNTKMHRRIKWRGKFCKHVKFHTRSNYKALTLDSSYQRKDKICWVWLCYILTQLLNFISHSVLNIVCNWKNNILLSHQPNGSERRQVFQIVLHCSSRPKVLVWVFSGSKPIFYLNIFGCFHFNLIEML